MALDSASPYAAAKSVTDPKDCIFYHTMELPGMGLIEGSWDLRPGIEEYLGKVDFSGKRALDVGTASGFLCWEMERRGAEVVAYDLSEQSQSWDLVPFGGSPDPTFAAERSAGLGRINNGWWLAHAALGSKAKVVYGSVYEMPDSIGQVQVAVFGAILLHLRDPFRALERALALTTETVVITEPAGRAARVLGRLPADAVKRIVSDPRLPATVGFLPDPKTGVPNETWWSLPPWTVARMIGVLGFDLASVAFHTQAYEGKPCPMYTLVGRRSAASSS